MSDLTGVEALRANRAKRTVPISRHPRPAPEVVDSVFSTTSGAAPAETIADARQAIPAQPQKAKGDHSVSVERIVVYLDPDQRQYLRELEAEGLRHGERVGASTAIRAALDELRQRGTSWEALVPHIRRRGPQPKR